MHRASPRILARRVVACVAAFVAVALSLAAPLGAQTRSDPATVTLAADLRRGPGTASPVLTTLAAGQRVTVLEMRGALAQVDADGQRGWMAVDKLRIGDAAAAAAAGGASGSDGSSWLRGITGLLGGGSGGSGSGAKVPIGVRGLQREDVANAQPDPAAVERLERFRASPDEALAYAGEAGLASRRVDYPDAPRSAGSSGASRGSDR